MDNINIRSQSQPVWEMLPERQDKVNSTCAYKSRGIKKQLAHYLKSRQLILCFTIVIVLVVTNIITAVMLTKNGRCQVVDVDHRESTVSPKDDDTKLKIYDSSWTTRTAFVQTIYVEEDIVKCGSNPCYNGECLAALGQSSCQCFFGYTGQSCDLDISDCASHPCQNGICTFGNNSYQCACYVGYTGLSCEQLIIYDCLDVLLTGLGHNSGVYTVTSMETNKPIRVYCDMETNMGGWTVFLHRLNGSRYEGSLDFNRSYSDYENGFGNLKGEFWLGLKHVYALTTKAQFMLRIDLELNNGRTGYEEFHNFSLSPSPNYTLHIGNAKGSLELGVPPMDSFNFHNNMPFSTFDHDHSGPNNCAATTGAGWWYSACLSVCLTCPHLDDYVSFYVYGRFGESAPNVEVNGGIKHAKMMFRKLGGWRIL